CASNRATLDISKSRMKAARCRRLYRASASTTASSSSFNRTLISRSRIWVGSSYMSITSERDSPMRCQKKRRPAVVSAPHTSSKTARNAAQPVRWQAPTQQRTGEPHGRSAHSPPHQGQEPQGDLRGHGVSPTCARGNAANHRAALAAAAAQAKGQYRGHHPDVHRSGDVTSHSSLPTGISPKSTPTGAFCVYATMPTGNPSEKTTPRAVASTPSVRTTLRFHSRSTWPQTSSATPLPCPSMSANSALLGFSSQLRMITRRLISAGLAQVGGGGFAEDVGTKLVAGYLAARSHFDGRALLGWHLAAQPMVDVTSADLPTDPARQLALAAAKCDGRLKRRHNLNLTRFLAKVMQAFLPVNDAKSFA